MLVQKRDLIGWEPDLLKFPTKARPSKEQLEDLRIAWLVGKHTKSNTIVLVKNRKVWGVGAGQMNRVESVRSNSSNMLASNRIARVPDVFIYQAPEQRQLLGIKFIGG